MNAQQPGDEADASGVGHRTWTRAQLTELVAGKRLLMRGAEAQDLHVPDWLAEHASELIAKDSSQSVDTTHPEDRGHLIETFIDSAAKPGVPCSCRIRNQIDDEWFELEVTWLNLLDDPDVAGILCVSERLAALEIEAPTEESGAVNSATPWMIVGLDAQGIIVRARGAVADILGYERDEVVGHSAVEFVHEGSMASIVGNWVELRQDRGRTRTSREAWTHRDGSTVWLEASFLIDEDDVVEVVMVDIGDRMANERALAASQRELAELAEDFRLVADEVPMPVFRCDASGIIDFRNSQWAESFPTMAEVRCLFDVFDVDGRERIAEVLRSESIGSTRVVEAPTADGLRTLAIRCRPVGDDPVRRRFVGSISDITDTVRLRHEASHDVLTGLANRLLITTELALALADDPMGLLVVYLDLDDFKAVNDSCGHEAGDAVLVEVADRLRRSVRPGDLVGRQGGDEFVVVCRGVAAAGGDVIVDRLRIGAFDAPIEFDGGTWKAAASIGVARPRPGDDAAAVLRRADAAMFDAKRAARGQLS